MNDRLMIAAMYAAGRAANSDLLTSNEHAESSKSLRFADALLAAAGEKEDPATHEDCVSMAVHNAVMDRLQVDFDALNARAEAAESKLAACERERDALNAEVWVHHPAVRAEYEAEIAALKRRLEPLTREEGGGVNNPTIYGSRPLAWDEITAIVADADRIRSRRQP